MDREEFTGISEAGGARFHILQPNRDLQSNWEVDLAKNLEEYLFKICSGEILSDQDHLLHSVNFAEAALLLQGSVQVYSRKVEYFYSLVLHALEFLSQKRQDQQEKASIQPDGSESGAVLNEENEIFLGLDDVPVEANICLDGGFDKGDTSKYFLKPPANLLVLEGDCLDTCCEASESESYLLATCDFYGDFLLLDPCDVGAVYDSLKTNAAGKENIAPHRGSLVRSKSSHSVLTSPTGSSGATSYRSNVVKNQGINRNQNTGSNYAFEINNDNHCSGLHVDPDHPDGNMCRVEEPNLGCSNVMDDSNDDHDNPWKPLNPHEPGNLKIKPFRKVKGFRRQVIRNVRRNTSTSQFPVAKLDGIISKEFMGSSEGKSHLQERIHAPQSPPLFEKLRRSLTCGKQETYDGFSGFEDENDDNGGDNHPPDFDQAEHDLLNSMCNMDTEVQFCHGKQSDNAMTFDHVEGRPQDDLDSHATLEDLCHSHLDALLASIAETEEQTQLATRVSTWKEGIEHTSEERDTRPPFDIHLYGKRILDKLSFKVDGGGSMSFTDVVMGQPKHDVAGTFSALLQLVNNGNVDLQRAPASDEFVCHTAANPFYVKLLCHARSEEMENCLKRKRASFPLRKGCIIANSSTSEATSPLKPLHQNGGFFPKLGKGSDIRCTPEGKRRRRSAQFIEPFDLQSSG